MDWGVYWESDSLNGLRFTPTWTYYELLDCWTAEMWEDANIVVLSYILLKACIFPSTYIYMYIAGIYVWDFENLLLR